VTDITIPQTTSATTPIVDAPQVLELCKSAEKIAICGHINPDGDALGSALALRNLLESPEFSPGVDRQVTLLLGQDGSAPELYDFLPNYHFIAARNYTDTPDLFICVDCPTLKRIGSSRDAFERAAATLVIDHHANYEGYADYYYGNCRAAATGNLIWGLIRLSGVTPTRNMALFCYVAILTDTGRFSFQNTNAQAFADATEMVRLGVSPSDVAEMVYESKSMAALKLEARLIERMRFALDGQLVCSYVTEQDLYELGIGRDATEGLPSILRSIAGVKVAVLLREETDGLRVNLRSRCGINVADFACAFGGGGHAGAAGFTLDMPLVEAERSVIPELEALISRTSST
jgi:phosphoesterase RecJ-like protein